MAGTDRIGIGVLGCGRIADLQVLGYRENPRARLVAVCDVQADLAARRRAEWGARQAYSNIDDLLSDADVDAVEILTPHDLHVPHTLAALAAGKHVSLQKPPTRTLAELDRLAEAAASAGLVLRVFENFAHYPPHRLARRLLDEGAVGTPLSVRVKTALGNPAFGWSVPGDSNAWRVDRERCGGGALTFDHGYHCFHMGQFFMPGVAVERVHAFIHWMRIGEREWIDGPALVSWKYEGDEPARFGSWEAIASIGLKVRSKYYVSDDRVEIHGSDGILWVNRCTGSLLEEPPVVLYRDGETRAFHDVETDWAASFRDGGIDFVDALLVGRPPSQTTEDARRTLAFALAARRSADEGREVPLAELG